MGYSFRVPLVLLSGGIRTEDKTFELLREGNERVWLQGNLNQPGPISLRGSGFADKNSALANGEDWTAVLAAALLQVNIDADFLARTGRGGGPLHPRVVDGVRVVADAPGVTAFPDDEEWDFQSAKATPYTLTDPMNLVWAVNQVSATVQADPHAVLGYDLYSARNLMPNPDAQLLTLVMALEVLITQSPLESVAQDLVSRLEEEVARSEVQESTKSSLLHRLEYFRVQSVGNAGRSLAATVGEQQFMETMTAADFFDHCYRLRSDLVHGEDRPPIEAVRVVLPELMRLTRILIQNRFSPYGQQ